MKQVIFMPPVHCVECFDSYTVTVDTEEPNYLEFSALHRGECPNKGDDFRVHKSNFMKPLPSMEWVSKKPIVEMVKL
jgi:hypothetical protein